MLRRRNEARRLGAIEIGQALLRAKLANGEADLEHVARLLQEYDKHIALLLQEYDEKRYADVCMALKDVREILYIILDVTIVQLATGERLTLPQFLGWLDCTGKPARWDPELFSRACRLLEAACRLQAEVEDRFASLRQAAPLRPVSELYRPISDEELESWAKSGGMIYLGIRRESFRSRPVDPFDW